MITAAASAYFLTTFAIFFFLKIVKNNSSCHQPIREDGPQNHLSEKCKTPTFGGAFIALATIISTLIFVDLSAKIQIILFVFASFAAIGLIDDLIKVICKNSNGFKGSIKLITQFAIIGASYLWLKQIGEIDTNIAIFEQNIALTPILFVIFFTCVIVGSANAVNLTDGLDGLVSVPVIINLICLITLSNSPEISNFCIILIASTFAFLQFNLKPAKIFMGDVGSLAIGATLGLIALIIKQEFAFFLISLLFVIEALSVIIQVTSYKLRKKRVFLMAPIHHHFEKKGWSEGKVVLVFWCFAAICAGLVVIVAF